ncbi:hypothetical protein CDD83_8241 [Cordyceps sp. RAO-2017]|nr:hypothetical protein CDD83_8241 [Cordyceps sp. RAO-2017]
MRTYHAITAAAALCGAVAGQAIPPASRNFARVPLEEPLTWTPGYALLLDHTIGRFIGELTNFTRDAWAQHVLDQCRAVPDCTSTFSYSAYAVKPDDAKMRFWFGYIYGGGPTTPGNYTRYLDVLEDTVAYTVVSS